MPIMHLTHALVEVCEENKREPLTETTKIAPPQAYTLLQPWLKSPLTRFKMRMVRNDNQTCGYS